MPLNTLQDYVIEYDKCKKDPIYFIQKYVKIELPGGSIPFPLYDVQKDFIKSLLSDHHVVTLKSRQTGISTTTQAFIAWAFTFYNNVIVGVVSKDQSEASDFARKTMSMLDELPDFFKPQYKKRVEQSFILKNKCQLYAQTIDPKNAGKLFRGKSVSIAVIDEAAHAQYIDEAFTGFGPALVKAQTVAKKRKIPFATIVISTPNKTVGIGKWYYETYTEALKGNNAYKPIRIHWSQIPEYANDPDWYKTQCKILNNRPDKIAQELDLEFIASTDSFFAPDIIKKLNYVQKHHIQEIKMNIGVLRIWSLPKSDKFYLIGVDTASSRGEDKSAVEIVDYETLEQCGEFYGKGRTDLFVEDIKSIAKMYKNNVILIEVNSYGNDVMEGLTNIENIGLYNVYQAVDKSGTNQYGIFCNNLIRPLLIESLYNVISTNPDIVKSGNLSLELISLQQNKRGKIEAAKGEHDDLCLALSYCCYIRLYDSEVKFKYFNKHANNDIIDLSISHMMDNDSTLGVNTIAMNFTQKKVLMHEVMNEDNETKRNAKFNKLVRNIHLTPQEIQDIATGRTSTVFDENEEFLDACMNTINDRNESLKSKGDYFRQNLASLNPSSRTSNTENQNDLTQEMIDTMSSILD